VVASGNVPDFLFVPPASGEIQIGDALEETYFIRDEMANLAWGVEHVVLDGSGAPASAQELSARSDTAAPTALPPPPPGEGASLLHYRIQTHVPRQWTPFVPVALDSLGRDVQLEQGVLITSATDPLAGPPLRGRILQPTRAEPAAYTILEQTIPRAGVRVSRVVNRTRWTNGETVIWVARRKSRSDQSAQSGLEHDLARIDDPTAHE
jgi:hypothetical protein